MCFVDDDRVVLAQPAVPLRLGEQDPVGHDLEQAVGAGPVGEPDLEADVAAERAAQLLGDPGGHAAGGDAPGLRVPDLR